MSTPGTITFVATVGEEGLGDLRGVKRLFNETLKDRIDRFVSIDGEGLGVTYIAIGSARFRVTFKGPGGHSFGSFGTVNPIHALGRAMARIADFQVPSSPRTTFNVGRIGGGTSINAIASEAWMEVDLRSGDTASLRSLEKQFRQAVNDAVAQENARWNSSALTVSIETVGDAARRARALVGADRSGRDIRLESAEPATIVRGRLDRRQPAAQPRHPGRDD